jgi:phage/plasmid-associated DNA primase
VIGACWRNFAGTHWREQEKHAGVYEVDLLLLPIIHEQGHIIKSNTILACAHRLIEGRCRRLFVAPHNLINFKNGTLAIPSLKMHPHRREDGLLYCLDYEYRPEVAHPRIDKYMQSTWLKRNAENEYETDHHMIQAIEAHIGLGLMADISMHQFIAQLGAKRAGKSMTMRLANAACGVANEYETEPIGRYGNFAGKDLFDNELEGKRVRFQRRHQRVVCCDELPPDVFITGEELIKDMTAHSGVPMRGMQKDDLTNNIWRPKLLISTNNLPRFVDYSGAVKERLVCVEAPVTIPKEMRNLDLLSELLEELPGWIHTCITLALKALQRGYYPQSGYMKARANALATSSNLLKRFVQERCVLEENRTVPSNVLYAKLCEFRDENGHKGQFTQQTMTHEILNMHIGVHNNEDKVSRKYDGIPKRLLFNIRLREDSEEIPEQTTEDDSLLIPDVTGHVTVFVTKCNGDVTDIRYKWHTPQNGSTSQLTGTPNTKCNDVTDFLENSHIETPTIEDKTDSNTDDTGNRVGTIQNNKTEKSVTSLQASVDEPVEPRQDVTETRYKSVTSPLQNDVDNLINDIHNLMTEVQGTFQQRAKKGISRLMWRSDGSEPVKQLTENAYLARVNDAIKSCDKERIHAAQVAMLRTLGRYEE